MCGFRKYPYPPRGRSLEIPRGRGFSTAKIEKGKYEAQIPEGREGSNEKTFHEGGMDIFWNHTIIPYYRKLTLHEINVNFKNSR